MKKFYHQGQSTTSIGAMHRMGVEASYTDICDDDGYSYDDYKSECFIYDHVLYAKNIKRGMTKNQVKYTFWGPPSETSSYSNGITSWDYDNYSWIFFAKGKVSSWHKTW